MKESLLKKEFKERDVQRMRNLATKKFGDKTRIQSGYEKPSIKHTEGEVWEENGKTWTIHRGIKQNITKFDGFKKLTLLPLCCPKCSTPMKLTQFNQKMYSIHQMCGECVIKAETKLKAQGKFEEYQKKMLNANKDSFVKDMSNRLETWYNEKNDFITEQGDIEDWSTSSSGKQEMYEEAKEILKKVKNTEL